MPILSCFADFTEMANITFSWMLDQISDYVSINEEVTYQDARARQNHIDELNNELRRYKMKIDQDKKEAAKRGWGQWANHALAVAADTVMHPLTRPEVPNIDRHDMGWGTGTIIDSYTRMYHVNGSKPRTPGTYAKAVENDAPGSTNEEIHPTVEYRYRMYQKLAKKSDSNRLVKKLDHDKLLYHPAGVREGFKRTQNDEGRWMYEFSKDVVVREHKIKMAGFERHALANAWDSRWRDSQGKPLTRETPAKYMRRLDTQNGEKLENETPLSDEGSSDEDEDH